MSQFWNANLNEVQSWWGNWWLPETPNAVRSGPLVIDESSTAELRIGPGFPARSQLDFATSDAAGVVHGMVKQRPVSLLYGGVRRAESIMGSNIEGPDEQVISASVVVTGKHICSDEEPLFKSVQFAIESMPEFLELWPYEITLEKQGPGWGLKSDRRISKSVTTENAEYAFATVMNAPFPRKTKGGAIFRSTLQSLVSVEYPCPASLEEIRATAFMLQRLIALATYSTPSIFSIKGREAGDSNGSPNPVYLPFPGSSNPDEDREDNSQLLFTSDDIELQDILPKWETLLAQNPHTYNPLFGFRYSESHFVESRISALVAAIEAISLKYEIMDFSHGLVNGRKPEQICLVDRLYGFALEVPEELLKVSVNNLKAFVVAARDARNGISHENDSNGEVEKMHAIATVLESILVYWTATKIGVPQQVLLQAIPYNTNAQKARDLSRKFFRATEQ